MPSAKTQYLCNIGLDYMNAGKQPKRAEPGDVVDDIPPASVEWLLEQGLISTDTDAEPVAPYQVFGEPLTDQMQEDLAAELERVGVDTTSTPPPPESPESSEDSSEDSEDPPEVETMGDDSTAVVEPEKEG